MSPFMFSPPEMSSTWQGKHTRFDDSGTASGSEKENKEKEEEDYDWRILSKGKHTRFDGSGNPTTVPAKPPRALSVWVNDIDKYNGVRIRYEGVRLSPRGGKLSGYSSRSRRSVSPELPISRDKPNVWEEVATFSIEDYNKRHNQTKFEVVDVLDRHQFRLYRGIKQEIRFTAKDVKSNRCAIRTFKAEVIIHTPCHHDSPYLSHLREVKHCDLQTEQDAIIRMMEHNAGKELDPS